MSVIAFGYYGFNNVGDDQLLTETMAILTDLSIDNPIVANGPATILYPSFNRWNLLSWVGQLIRHNTLLFGGGSIFQSMTGFGSLLYYAVIVQLAYACNCNVMLLCHGWGPFKQKWHERFAAWTLRKACRSWRLPPPACFYSDPVFCDLTLTQPLPTISKNASGIGISIRSAEMAAQVNHYFQMMGSSAPLNCNENKLIAATWHSNHTPLELLITDRLHSAIWASRHGIPWVGISTDPKLMHIANQANQPCFSSIDHFVAMFNWTAIDGKHLRHWVTTHSKQRHRIQKWLHEHISH